MAASAATPHGAWPSPITAALVAEAWVLPSQPQVDGDDIYWLEMRPEEGGRYVLIVRRADAAPEALTPEGFNVRTRVHEYGGGAYMVRDGVVYFSNFDDQRVYRHEPGGEPQPITPEPSTPAAVRFADARVTPDGRWLLCVRETHGDAGVVNELVAVATDGAGAQVVLSTGRDFYAFPRISPDGARLAWTCWDHPQMPWDGCELWVGDLRVDDNGEPTLDGAQRVEGGPEESIFQPEWSPEGELHFVSDRSGWWNLYRSINGRRQPVFGAEADAGLPQWEFGYSTYAFLTNGRIACAYTFEGEERLAVLNPAEGTSLQLATPFTEFDGVTALGNRVVAVAAGPQQGPAVVTVAAPDAEVGHVSRPRGLPFDDSYLSAPEVITFPTTDDAEAHGIFYPPTSPEANAPEGALPPLIVMSHGGPTSAARTSLKLSQQFWTSRGFAVVDVNYRGSTGYGRDYRRALNGRWGVVDVDDCIAAARYLAERGSVDGGRLAIRGGSAGGYTTLCALVFHDDFSAGASHFGVADAEALARDTHKFESRYLDTLIGPHPEAADLYRERSPIHFAHQFTCPVILFQGLEDEVVPPSQAETLVAALEEKGLPYAYLAFEGEQHGFRRAENIIRALEAELYFYGRVFGFEPADEIEPVDIANLEP